MSHVITLPTDKFQKLYLEYLHDGFNSFNGWLLTLNDDEFYEIHPQLTIEEQDATDDQMDYQGNFVYIMISKSDSVTMDMVNRLSHGDLIDEWDKCWATILASINLMYLLKKGYVVSTNRDDIDDEWAFELTDLGHNTLNLPGEGFLKFSKN